MVSAEPMAGEHSQLRLDLDSYAVPALVEVRRWAAEAMADLGEDHLSAVQLVATELLTNTYDHAPGARQLRLRRERHPCRLRIEVDDDSPRPPTLAEHLDSARGRGLMLVDKLASEWGSDPLPGGGKTVWASIDCTGYPWQACP